MFRNRGFIFRKAVVYTGVLISPKPEQEGNKLQGQKNLMFIYLSSSKIKKGPLSGKNDHNALWHYRNNQNAKFGITETVTTRNYSLWNLE